MTKKEQVDRAFTYHALQGDQALRYTMIREKAHEYALFLLQYTPESREQSLALTNLEQVVMWAIASIARNE